MFEEDNLTHHQKLQNALNDYEKSSSLPTELSDLPTEFISIKAQIPHIVREKNQKANKSEAFFTKYPQTRPTKAVGKSLLFPN